MEINTYEASPARPHIRLPFDIASPWWSGHSDILTFEPAELIATKLRALYQRHKGRDLFDIWLALTSMIVDPASILACFEPYRPDGYTTATALANLEAHLADRGFRRDVIDLGADATGYNATEAAEMIATDLLRQL